MQKTNSLLLLLLRWYCTGCPKRRLAYVKSQYPTCNDVCLTHIVNQRLTNLPLLPAAAAAAERRGETDGCCFRVLCVHDAKVDASFRMGKRNFRIAYNALFFFLQLFLLHFPRTGFKIVRERSFIFTTVLWI